MSESSGGSSHGERPASSEAPAPPIPKGYRRGTHRLCAPEETVERVRRFMPMMGITRVANVTGLDVLGIPVVMVCRPNSRSLAVSQGKGLDLASAKASGLMESVESYHAERVTLPIKLGSHTDLRLTHPLVDVDLLPRLTVSAYRRDAQILWIEGVDLVRDGPCWVPYEMVHTNFTLPLPTGSGSFFMSSNGLASGNHLLEAASHGICEVVERDATSLWHMLDEDARRQTRIHLDSVDDPGCREVLERCERAGVAVAVWDTTSDIGIPAFLCTLVERDPSPLRPLYPTSGMGCHPAREVALLRALTEAAQARLTLIAGSRDDVARRRYTESQDLDSVSAVQARVRTDQPMRAFSDVPTSHGETFDDDVQWEIQGLRMAGIESVVVVDLSKPELDIPVVRVIIPGLEALHDAPGYVPGPRARRRLEGRGA
jgi:ribosomal protein S12 methylthiotransferase accessory factor